MSSSSERDLPRGWVSSAEAAEALGVTVQHIRRLCRLGDLQGIRVQGWLIERRSLQGALKKSGRRFVRELE